MRPMIFSHLLTKTLWVVPLILQAAIALLMWRRKLVRIFPIFFTYTVLVPSRDTALLFLTRDPYFLVYWGGEALAVLLGLGVIFEILRHLFPPHPFLRVVWKSVWVLGSIAALTALLLLVLAHSGTETRRVLESTVLLERAARFLQVCLLIVVIALMSRLGLTWHHYSLGIVAGFGVYSALDLAALEFRAHWHSLAADATFALVRPAAYNLGAIIWAAYFLPSWSKKPVEYLPRTDLAEWNATVSDYIDQWYRRY